LENRVRGFPEIEFVDSDTGAIIDALTQGYETLTKRRLYPADPARLFILWVADILVSINVNIDHSAKMNIPRYATGVYLDALAELFKGVSRLPPAPARTTLRFTLSAALPDAVVIPAGTRATPDGKINFATENDLIITAGEISGEVAAMCTAITIVGGTEHLGGTVGNSFAAGEIDKLVDLFPYYGTVANITTSEGGADVEDDDSLYERMRKSEETYSTAGASGAYEYWAKTASALVADVAVSTNEPGTVDIRVLLQNGALPQEEVLDLVRTAVNDEKVRPLTDNVTVSAPDTVAYSIDFTYYLTLGNSAQSATEIIANVAAAVDEYKAWQSGKLGRDINPSRLEYLLMRTGVKRVVIRSPIFIPVNDKSVAVLDSENAENGGFENG
jgi:phage-related baseplate assembly protein